MRTPSANAVLSRNRGEWLLLIAAFVLIGGFLIFGHRGEVDRNNVTERERLQMLAKLVANDIQSSLTNTNMALEGVIQDHLAANGTVSSHQDISRRLRALQVAIPGIRAMVLLDANGIVTASSMQRLIDTDLSQRDYFKTASAKPNKFTLYVSEPIQSLKKEKDLVITVSRVVPNIDEKFAGLIVAVLKKEYFSNIFKTIIYAPDVTGFVVHSDGRKFLNYPELPDSEETNLFGPWTFVKHHLDSGLADSVLTGTLEEKGEQRLLALSTVQPAVLHMDKAVVTGISRSLAKVGQPLQNQAIAYVTGYTLLVLLCTVGLYWAQSRRKRIAALNDELERQRDEADRRVAPDRVLRQSEARFRTLIEDAPLAIAILRASVVIYTNRRYNNLHGYLDADDLTGLFWSAMLSDQSNQALQAEHALIAADSPIEQRFEAEGRSKKGNLVPVFKCTARVELADGPATLIFAQDISAQKRAELLMEQSLDMARTASRSKAEFLANMSHEIRSPLNVILGLAYLLEQSHLSFDAQNMVRKIRASGRSLLAIINDILDVSKIEAGRMIIEKTQFNLDDVIDSIASTMGVAAGDKDIQLIIRPLPKGISHVVGDPLRLEQLLSNLTSNAIKFTHAGRVELHIDLMSRSDENIVLRFRVQDTGIGITPEKQIDVFSAFTQADSTTTRRFGGTGLGLTICQQLVELMGGEIGVSSEEGAGSEFWFTLPLLNPVSAEFSSPEMVNIDALIADDSEPALEAMVGIAHRLGWQVSAVTSGEAALSQVRARMNSKLPDVIVLDWNMPGMDGIATACAIRESVPADVCPIVIMATAYSVGTLSAQPGSELVDAVLSKPVTASTLYNAVMEARAKQGTITSMMSVALADHDSSLEGVNVLVVDDSEINREVAKRILCEHGAHVTLAVDGQTALDWLLAHPDDVDLVLMDVQMPAMDGLETTRQLRLHPHFDDLPIVALTAGAFKSQQEAARAVGMSDFVSKPFEVPALIALIQRLRRRAPGGPVVAIQSETAISLPSAIDQAIDPGVLNVKQGMHIWSDIHIYRNYLRRFAADYGDTVVLMKASLANGDIRAAAAIVHKLAGVAGNMGLPDVCRLAIEAEQELSKNFDTHFDLENLTEALENALKAINRFAPSEPTVAKQVSHALTPSELNPDDLARITNLFASLLKALDTDSPVPVEPILAELGSALPHCEFTSIQELVRCFDFRTAETETLHLAGGLGIVLTGEKP